MASAFPEKALYEIGHIGFDQNHPEKGRDCLAFSENEKLTIKKLEEYADLLKEKACEIGMGLNYFSDTFGNFHLILEGETARQIMITSHIDSVPKGGRYDGILGVSGGFAAIENLIDKKLTPKKSIRVVACRAEESSSTKQACLGSLLATGAITYEQLQELEYQKDKNTKIPLLDYMKQQLRLTTDQIKQGLKNPSIKLDETDGALELHIEQSGVLEKLDKPIGLVTGGIGSASRKEIYIKEDRSKVKGRHRIRQYKGLENHSGGTPMNGEIINLGDGQNEEFNLRDDALVKAIKDLATKKGLRIAKITVPDGSCNTVPGQCIVEFVEEEKGEDEIECISKSVAEAVHNIVVGTEKIAEKIAFDTQGKARATIGNVTHDKGNIILHLDQRMLEEKAGEDLISQLEKLVEAQRALGIDINSVQKGKGKPVKFEGDVKNELIKAYKDLFDDEPFQMSSMPGHDLSKIVQKRADGTSVPGAMIFVRSLNNGISHNPNEYSSPEDIEQGVKLLCEVVERISCK